MSTVRANTITNSAGSGAPDFPNGLSAATIPAANLTGTLPAINGSALTNLPAPTSAQVGTATAGLAAGAVGSYALLWAATSALRSSGATVAGSGLRYANTYNNSVSLAGNSTETPSGTWQLMGNTSYYNATSTSEAAGLQASVWLRIS